MKPKIDSQPMESTNGELLNCLAATRWHELKEYNRRVVKPTNKQQLIDRIQQFWETVSSKMCQIH